MNTQDLIRAIHRLKVETGSLACFGCGYERSCSVRGCAILRSAAAALGKNQWINVKDRLPDLIPCNAGTAYSEAVITWTSGRKAMIAVWDGSDWVAPFDYWEAWGEEITHWMPLPHPPKGE